jgi:acetamidase/formamidase
MCRGDDTSCPDYEEHVRSFRGELDAERRSFLKSSLAATGGVAAFATGGISLVTPALAQASQERQPATRAHHFIPASAETVHWGYFSKSLKPQVELSSGDYVTIETLTHHANDDNERMIKGDPGAESVYLWTKDKKGVNRRGAGPMDASIHGRGAGEGFGVHIMTGPVSVRGAEAGDILEVRIIDVAPRPCVNPEFKGKSFGSNAAAWWGFHYKDLLTEPKPREVITIYEIDASGARNWAQAVYNFQWVPQTDPFGVVHKIIDYPGVPVDHSKTDRKFGVLKGIRVPIRPHFGVMGLAPKEADIVDSSRQAIPAAISTTGESGRAPSCITRSRSTARCCRSAIRMRPKATANSAAPRSSAR